MQHWEVLEAIYWEAMLEQESRQKWQESIVKYIYIFWQEGRASSHLFIVRKCWQNKMTVEKYEIWWAQRRKQEQGD